MVELLEKLKDHIPFTLLDENAFELISRTAQIAYYPNETSVIEKGKLPASLFVIIKGAVDVLAENGEHIDLYHSNDTFGGIELIEEKPSAYHYNVTEELICYEIPPQTFRSLCEENNAFKTYFFSSIVERIDMLKEKKEYASLSDLMVARIDESILHKGCVVDATTPVISALQYMESCNASSLLVENDEGYGIVTDADFRYYLMHKGEKNLQIIGDIQSYPAISIKKGELLFNILLLMTEHSIKHLPVFDEKEEFIGVMELVDLVSYFSNQSHLITVQMDRAQSIAEVVRAAKRLEVMIGALHAKGVKSRYIAKLVSEINKKMYKKLFDMVFPESWHERCTLVLLGSEGRASQILRTDQDNALIFEEGFVPEDADVLAHQFIEVLDEIGYPRCKGGVMLINEKWRKEIDAYRDDIKRWVDQPNYENLMDMAIFFDAAAVAGKRELHSRLVDFLLERVKGNSTILIHFSRAIESFESPLGLFSQFVHDKGHENEIDIKKGALFAIIHGIRALALEYGIKVTNSTLRIKELNNIGYMNKEDAKELMEALEVLHTLRLHAQLEKLGSGKPINNYVSLDKMGKLERDLFKEALKTANRFKKTVSYHFHLSSIG